MRNIIKISFLVLVFINRDILHAAEPVVDVQAIQSINQNTKVLTEHSASVQSSFSRDLVESVNHTTQLVNTVTNLDTQIEQLEIQIKAMTENLSRALGFDDMISDMISDLNSQTPSFITDVDIETGRRLDFKQAADIEKALDQIVPPYGSVNNKDNYNMVHGAYMQRSIKSSIESSELYINRSENRLEEVNNIVMKINTTESLKDSVDLNSRLMAELLTEQIQNNIMLAKYIKISSTEKFRGEIHNAKVGTDTYEEYLDKRSKSLPLR